MSDSARNRASEKRLMLGNEALAWGALAAGVQFAAGYPGTPSSEIIQTLSRAAGKQNIHVEWSSNEKAATEGAAAAAFAGLRSLAAMKNAGLSVALDFLTHLSYTGLGDRGGGMVVVVCDDPEAHSSGDETDSRWLARFASVPLLEPADLQEAVDLVKVAFELSEEFGCYVMLRGYTRLCHASRPVAVGAAQGQERRPRPDTVTSLTPYLARPKHAALLEKLERIRERFESSAYHTYAGPERPELLIISSGGGFFCASEAVELLGLENRVGILKLSALWPFPRDTVASRLRRAPQALIVEEVDPFVEALVMETLARDKIAGVAILGKASGHVPAHGEITPDKVTAALSRIFNIPAPELAPQYQARVQEIGKRLLITRGLTWCPGCPHRASFWALERAVNSDGREIMVTGDIGCYTLDVFPEGKGQTKLLHAMGSGTGLAAGFGQLGRLGGIQPVISVCGDSTFFHASIPALINAVYNGADMIQIVLDNAATAMTGFQAHPGTGFNAAGEPAASLDIVEVCRALNCRVEVQDPFDVRGTIRCLRRLLKEETGVRVLVLRRRCEIVRMKQEKTRPFEVRILEESCRGGDCALCSSGFRCPALYLNEIKDKAEMREELCSGCGVCAEICPFDAITRGESA